MQNILPSLIIDWTDPKCSITPHFNVRDALWLHNWGRLAHAGDSVDFDKIVVLCTKLEEVRAILGQPMFTHSMFRSPLYNLSQKILPTSDVHSESMAYDFDCGPYLTIDEIKDILRPKLEELGLRMERGTTTWVHVDLHPPGVSGREFTA